MGEKLKVLITCKTYPIPSTSYHELVCTGGVRDDGSFIRLYPIDYRYRPYWEWYKKYQWVEIEVEKNPRDQRPESYRPVAQTPIRTLGEPLTTKSNWAERKRYVLAKGTRTMCELQRLDQRQCSLGIVRPKRVFDVVVEETERHWTPRQEAVFQQLRLFGPEQKPLEKIPYHFRYHFECDEPGCRGHKQCIEDWEVGQLYRSMRQKYASEQIAVEKVREKLFNGFCDPGIDLHFFVGTVLKYGSWVIVGTFTPPKTAPGQIEMGLSVD